MTDVALPAVALERVALDRPVAESGAAQAFRNAMQDVKSLNDSINQKFDAVKPDAPGALAPAQKAAGSESGKYIAEITKVMQENHRYQFETATYNAKVQLYLETIASSKKVVDPKSYA